MENRLAQSDARRRWRLYAIAILAPFLALAVRLPLNFVLADKVPYMTFFAATAVSAGFGGLGPGLVSTFVGAALAVFYLIPPTGSFVLRDTGDSLGLGLFLSVGSFISYLSGRLQKASLHENALRLLFQQTLVSIGDAIISTDEQKTVRLLNPVAERLTGWSSAEARGRPIQEIFSVVQEGTDGVAVDPVDRVLQSGKVVGLANHTELITRTGRRIPIDDSGAPIFDQNGQLAGAVLVFRDITARREAELALAAAEKRSRNILGSISEAFFLLDSEWRIAEINSAGTRLIGIPASELLGRVYWDVFPATVGTPLETAFRKALADRKPVQLENRYDPWERWYDVSAYPSDEGLSVYFREITEKKQSEAALQRLNEDLKQFTFAATHDVREPLRMITVYVQMLQRRLEGQLDTLSDTYITQVVNGAHRISRLMDGLLQFSRIGEIEAVEPCRVDAEPAFREAIDDLQIAIREAGAVVEHELLPSVMADDTHVRQLFQNLVGNALKYTRPSATPRIRISAQREGSLWVFAVHDNGIGIAPKHQEQIFLPFRRLHGSEIPGAGIGLATCKRIVERYHGRIWVESSEGEGSTFYFSLPAAEEGFRA